MTPVQVDWPLPGRALTVADLESMPDDGRRYELIDGVLVVSPSPSWQHQGVVTNLSSVLQAACPRDLRVFVAPLDVRYGQETSLQPDVLVARRADLGERRLEGGPVLAVEVLSHSTRHLDLGFKLRRYEAAGCPSYWVVDPVVPSVVCWNLIGARYQEVAQASGDQSVALELPFPVRLSPADLLH